MLFDQVSNQLTIFNNCAILIFQINRNQIARKLMKLLFFLRQFITVLLMQQGNMTIGLKVSRRYTCRKKHTKQTLRQVHQVLIKALIDLYRTVAFCFLRFCIKKVLAVDAQMSKFYFSIVKAF